MENIDMSRVPYSSKVGSLACATTCVRLDLIKLVRIASMYVASMKRDHLTKPIEKFTSLGLVVTW